MNLLSGIGLLCMAVVILLIAVLNIADHRRRAKMTPAQRRTEDLQDREDAQIW